MVSYDMRFNLSNGTQSIEDILCFPYLVCQALLDVSISQLLSSLMRIHERLVGRAIFSMGVLDLVVQPLFYAFFGLSG
jgi:hypothetical protein